MLFYHMWRYDFHNNIPVNRFSRNDLRVTPTFSKRPEIHLRLDLITPCFSPLLWSNQNRWLANTASSRKAYHLTARIYRPESRLSLSQWNVSPYNSTLLLDLVVMLFRHWQKNKIINLKPLKSFIMLKPLPIIINARSTALEGKTEKN